MMLKLISLVIAVGVVLAQDPAPGWLGYATATCPPGTRVTKYSANWAVGGMAQPSSAFYSPWIGIDTTDNLNLLQPVNPWFGSSWYLYTEYYQWNPTNNQDSSQQSTNSGDILLGSITYLGNQQYQLVQNDTTAGVTSSMQVKVQKSNSGMGPGYKNYSVFYVVYEKVARCRDYPPEGIVTFSNIYCECDGVQITPSWTTSYVEDVCNNRANVVNASTITITWDTSSKDPAPELIARSQSTGFSGLNHGKKVRPVVNKAKVFPRP
jgi:hypothetical protein